MRHILQNMARLRIHRNDACLLLLGVRPLQSDEASLKINVFPLQAKQRTAPHPRTHRQPHKPGQKGIVFLIQCTQKRRQLHGAQHFGFHVIDLGQLDKEARGIRHGSHAALDAKPDDTLNQRQGVLDGLSGLSGLEHACTYSVHVCG